MFNLEDPDYEKRESFARTVMDLINADVTFPMVPQSPDVTPLGFFFGLCKIKSIKVRDIGMLRDRIQLTVTSITDRMLVNT